MNLTKLWCLGSFWLKVILSLLKANKLNLAFDKFWHWRSFWLQVKWSFVQPIVIQSVCPEIAQGAIILKLIWVTFSRERLRSSTDHRCMQRKVCNWHWIRLGPKSQSCPYLITSGTPPTPTLPRIREHPVHKTNVWSLLHFRVFGAFLVITKSSLFSGKKWQRCQNRGAFLPLWEKSHIVFVTASGMRD